MSDVEVRGMDLHGRYEETLLEGRAFSIESGGRQRVLLQSAEIDGEEVAPGQSILMYLSVPLTPGKGFEVMDTRAFVVWSDVSAEFSGFLEPLDHKRSKEWKNMRGRYRGVLREPQTGELKPVEIAVMDAPVVPVTDPEMVNLDGYAEEIRSHLFRLEFDATEREYWRAQGATAGGESATK